MVRPTGNVLERVLGGSEYGIGGLGQGPDFAGCPTNYVPPSSMITAKLGGLGNPLLQRQLSGQTLSIPLPVTGFNSGVVQFGESAGGAYTPQPVTLEISINKCPGLVEPSSMQSTSGLYCNMTGTNGNYNAISWFAKAYGPVVNMVSAQTYTPGMCWAASEEGKHYINTRWTYSHCAFGASTCGFAIQQNLGPY
jgi:hypothetical protein